MTDFKKSIDKSKERKFDRIHPKQGIERRKKLLNKLVDLGPGEESSFGDILRPDEAKAVEKIDDKSIFWAQIMRIILTYTKNNDLATFINSVEILDASLGDGVSSAYKTELKKVVKERNAAINNLIIGHDGRPVNDFAVPQIERKYWLNRFKCIINELTRKGLWSLKGH